MKAASVRPVKSSKKKVSQKPVFRRMMREIAEARAIGRKDGRIVDALGFLRMLKK